MKFCSFSYQTESPATEICTKRIEIMKEYFKSCCLMTMIFLVSCSDLFSPVSESTGSLRINFADDFARQTKADGIPEPEDFILSISSSEGDIIWKGIYKESPVEFQLGEGSYTVSAVSEEFEEPKYDSPQYGDIRVVSISAGKSANVELNCSQMNAGILVEADAGFRTEYPDGELYLKSDEGTLMHSYNEKRIAFFKPGPVSLVLGINGVSQTLCTRSMTARQMLKINLSASVSKSNNGSRISVSIDTTRNWENEYIETGGEGAGSSKENPMSVQQARNSSEGANIWVWGYIVGVASGTGRFSFDAPFDKYTNLIIGSRSNSRDAGSCMSIELTKGSIRDGLNLVDNPELLGRKLVIQGTVSTAYYGIPGLKSPSGYMLKE